MENAPSIELGELGARLRALEDERAILDTMYRYCRALDYRRIDEFVDCFTSDGAFELRSRHRPAHRKDGRDALRGFITDMQIGSERVFGDAAALGAEGHAVKHLCIEPRVTLDGDHATVESYFAHLDEFEDRPVVWTYGVFRDRFVRSGDGRWRIRERICEQEALHPAGRG